MLQVVGDSLSVRKRKGLRQEREVEKMEEEWGSVRNYYVIRILSYSLLGRLSKKERKD